MGIAEVLPQDYSFSPSAKSSALKFYYKVSFAIFLIFSGDLTQNLVEWDQNMSINLPIAIPCVISIGLGPEYSFLEE